MNVAVQFAQTSKLPAHTFNKMKDIEKRIEKLEKDSHPPVNWKELIHSNIERIEKLEMDTHEFMDIIKHIVQEKKTYKKDWM